MLRQAATLFVFLFLLTGFSQEKKESVPTPPQAPSDTAIPAEAAKRENPVKPSEASIAEGRKLFKTQCLMCHGEGGQGNGDLVEPMKLKLRDWSDPAALKDLTDGALFYLLDKGRNKMPGQEGRMKDEQKWSLINYIRSLAKKEGAAKPKEPAKPTN